MRTFAMKLARAAHPGCVERGACRGGFGAGRCEFFSPQGEVKGVRQVTRALCEADGAVRRSARARPVQRRLRSKRARALGRHEELGVRLRPRPARRRSLQLHAEDRSHGRRRHAAAGGQRFEFSTGGPAILRSLPWEGAASTRTRCSSWASMLPRSAETIAANAYCVAAGINERIGVRLVTGDERKIMLDNRKSFAASYLRVLLLDGDAGPHARVHVPAARTGSDDDKFLRLRDAADSPLVTLACARTLPPDVEAKLVWGKGIASTTRRRDERRPGARVQGASGVSRVVLLRARQQGRAVHSDPAADAVVHGAHRRARCRADPPRRRRGQGYPAKLPKDDADDSIDARERSAPGCPSKQTFRLELPPASRTTRAAR